MLFTGAVKVSRDGRHSLNGRENSSLVIQHVVPEDKGSYTCQIMIADREMSVTHRLQVVSNGFDVQPVSSP